MKYNLTEQQWILLWRDKHTEWQMPFYGIQSPEYDHTLSDDLNARLFTWNKLYKSQFNLSYNEYDDIHDDNEEIHPNYWGFIEGNEKDITLFLLSL